MGHLGAQNFYMSTGKTVNIKGNPHKWTKKDEEGAAKEEVTPEKGEEEKADAPTAAPEAEEQKQTKESTEDSPAKPSDSSKKSGKPKGNRKKGKASSPRNRKPVPMSPKGSGRRKKEPAAAAGEKHELHSAWTIHVNKKPDRGRSRRDVAKQSTDEYLKSLTELGTFKTIEDFWKLYSFLKHATDIPPNYVLSVFRKDLDPAWETFPNGGCWIIRVSRDHNDPDVLNRLWEELLFAVIGEAFKTPDLAGVMLLKKSPVESARKGGNKDKKQSGSRNRDAVTIWNAGSSPDSTAYMKIGERLRSVCNLDKIEPKDGSKLTIEYKRFRESLLRDKSTTMNARKYVYQPLYT